VGKKHVPLRSLDPYIVERCPGQVELRPVDVVLRMALHPGVIQAGMVGNEIEEQPQPAPPEPLAQAGERRIASEPVMNGVAGDGKTRAGDVPLTEVRERVLELAAPLAVGAGDPTPGFAG